MTRYRQGTRLDKGPDHRLLCLDEPHRCAGDVRRNCQYGGGEPPRCGGIVRVASWQHLDARAAVRGHPVACELRRHRLHGDAFRPKHIAEAVEIEPERRDQCIARLLTQRSVPIGEPVEEIRQPGGRTGGVTLPRGAKASQIGHRRADRADGLPVRWRRAGRRRIDRRAERRGRPLDYG